MCGKTILERITISGATYTPVPIINKNVIINKKKKPRIVIPQLLTSAVGEKSGIPSNLDHSPIIEFQPTIVCKTHALDYFILY